MKSQINQYLRQNGIIGQKAIRQASWRHAELCRKHQDYHEEAQDLYDEIGTIPCALSKQEAFHITHYVNAILLVLLKPEKAYNLTKQTQGPINLQVAQITEDKNECEVYKALLHNHLWQVIQNYGKTQTKSTNRRLQEMEERIQQLESYTGVNDNGKDRIQS